MGAWVAVGVVVVLCTGVLAAAVMLLRDAVKTAVDQLRQTLDAEFAQRAHERAHEAERQEAIVEAGRVTEAAQQAVAEMRALVDLAHQEYRTRSAALDERESALREREKALGVVTADVSATPGESEGGGEAARPPVPLAINPKDPPRVMIFQPKDPSQPTPPCECHGDPVSPGETVMWWPDATVEGAVHLFCDRGVADLASQVQQS